MKPKNWDQFQHYKDRCPPWIKLHRDLLNNRDFMMLPLESKALAPMLWLLASESQDGSFDASIEELMFRLRMSEQDIKKGLKSLIDKGFFVDDSQMLAECYQVATPETETETERETKKEKKATKVATPDGVSQSLWDSFLTLRKAKKAPVTQAALDGIQREATKAGWTLDKALEECCSRGWTGFKADWVADKKPTTFAQQAADVIRMTVPGSKELDPALKKIEEDRSRATPPPADFRALVANIKGALK